MVPSPRDLHSSYPQKCPKTNINDNIGTNAIAISYQDVVQIATTDPYTRIVVFGETEQLGRSFPGSGTSSCIQATSSFIEVFPSRTSFFFVVLARIDAIPYKETLSDTLA